MLRFPKFQAWLAVLILFSPLACWAASSTDTEVGSIGASPVWIFANISYAGMRAQSSLSGWRIVAFIFGFPGTLLSLLVIKEGGERMYGIDVPRAKP